MDHEKFFEKYGKHTFFPSYYENIDGVGIEELYQAFKARMLSEIEVAATREQIVSISEEGP